MALEALAKTEHSFANFVRKTGWTGRLAQRGKIIRPKSLPGVDLPFGKRPDGAPVPRGPKWHSGTKKEKRRQAKERKRQKRRAAKQASSKGRQRQKRQQKQPQPRADQKAAADSDPEWAGSGADSDAGSDSSDSDTDAQEALPADVVVAASEPPAAFRVLPVREYGPEDPSGEVEGLFVALARESQPALKHVFRNDDGSPSLERDVRAEAAAASDLKRRVLEATATAQDERVIASALAAIVGRPLRIYHSEADKEAAVRLVLTLNPIDAAAELAIEPPQKPVASVFDFPGTGKLSESDSAWADSWMPHPHCLLLCFVW